MGNDDLQPSWTRWRGGSSEYWSQIRFLWNLPKEPWSFTFKPVLLMKIITSSEERNKIPIRFYINNQGQGARKISTYSILSWVTIIVLGIFSEAWHFSHKQNYISFLKLSDNWNASHCSIFSRPKCDAQRSRVTSRGLGFTLYSLGETSPFGIHVEMAIGSPDHSSLRHVLRGYQRDSSLYPQRLHFSVWRQGPSFLRTRQCGLEIPVISGPSTHGWYCVPFTYNLILGVMFTR